VTNVLSRSEDRRLVEARRPLGFCTINSVPEAEDVPDTPLTKIWKATLAGIIRWVQPQLCVLSLIL
jgi:hypothetical protein